jgi:hypothetical protein
MGQRVTGVGAGGEAVGKGGLQPVNLSLIPASPFHEGTTLQVLSGDTAESRCASWDKE